MEWNHSLFSVSHRSGETHSQQLSHHWMIRVGEQAAGWVCFQRPVLSQVLFVTPKDFLVHWKEYEACWRAFAIFIFLADTLLSFILLHQMRNPALPLRSLEVGSPPTPFCSICVLLIPNGKTKSLPFTGKGNDSDADRLKNLSGVTALISGRIRSEPSCS